MLSYRNVLPSGRMLTRRLNQLRSTLDALGSRLRTAVSQAVGETVGVVVRDALNTALDQLAGFPPAPDPPPARSREWYDDDEQDPWPNDGWDDEKPELYERAPPDESRSNQLALSLSAGLAAAAWWWRRWTGRFGLVRTAVVGVLTSCTVYSAPVLATVGLRLIGSAGQVAFLSDAAQAFAAS